MNKKHFYAAVILLLLLAVGIQPALAIDIPTDTSVGTWDGSTYTLTEDVTVGLVIVQGDLTLDGAGHTITGAGAGSGTGILIQKVENVTITNVTIKNVTVSKFDNGIDLNPSHLSTLMYNTIENNTFGILLHSSNGNVLSGNTVRNHESNGSEGIGIHGSLDNIITRNTVQENYNGIVIMGQSQNNEVYNNNFLYNEPRQAYVTAAGNFFYLDLPIGGNYWSNYYGSDDGSDGRIEGDGIGDTDIPYTSNGAVDNFPWILPNGWSPQAMILHLIDTVEEMNLQQGIDNSLDAKLDAAANALDDINQNNDVAAINSLNAFKNAVEAQRGGKLTDAQADTLIVEADSIIGML